MNSEEALALAHAVARARGETLDVWTLPTKPDYTPADARPGTTEADYAEVDLAAAMDAFLDDRTERMLNGTLAVGSDDAAKLFIGAMQSLGSVVVRNAIKKHVRENGRGRGRGRGR